MQNIAFERTLKSISHPVSIGAIAMVLLNDHLLRRVAPSWFTGKIGDFAWLIFAPFLLMAILAWLPFRSNRRAEIVGYGSLIGTGLIFGFAKTWPEFHALTIKVLETLTGWPNVLRMDPTDALALPALLIAWWIWKQSVHRSIALPPRGWVLLPLAVLATMADSPATNYGIVCVHIDATPALIAGDTYSRYISQDGGLTWQTSSFDNSRCGAGIDVVSLFKDPNNAQVQYRFISQRSIERSIDDGQTWQTEYNLMQLSDAQAAYYTRNQASVVARPGPFEVAFDPTSGNVVAAMGFDGVLVRPRDGQWRWINIGSYSHADLTRIDQIVSLLAYDLLLALALAFLSIGAWARALTHRRVNRIGQLLAWLFWIGASIATLPAFNGGETKGLIIYPIILALLLSLFVGLRGIDAIFVQNTKLLSRSVMAALLTAILFTLPFFVWTQNGIPFYDSALLYALVLTLATSVMMYRYLRALWIETQGTPT